MAQPPDISSILAALAQQNASAPQTSATPQQLPQGLPGYPPTMMPVPSASAPPQASPYLPQPSSTGSVDLSAIKPISSGSVSIADAIAKARGIAADQGMQSYNHRQQAAPAREDPRLAGRGGHQRSRSRSRSPSRHDGYGGNPYRDERREDPRRGNFRRSPSPDRGFRGGNAGGRGGEGETETIRVKSSLVGLVIGRNGENLRKVEAETGARVQFIQAKDSHVPERQCTISGSLRARENAKAAIFAIIEENGGGPVQEKGAYAAGVAGRAKVNLPALRDGEASTQIMVPDKTVGLIIGRGGETIKDLQERSGCHVNIVGENKSINGLRPVNLIGNERATALARELILEIVESDSRAPTGSNAGVVRDRGFDMGNGRTNSSSGAMGGGGTVEKSISVPSSAVGMIIGKGGETIKEMQRTTGCKINVNQPKPPDVTRKIDLSGTARAMDEAERIIWQKVETVRQRDAAAGGGSNDQGGASYDAYSQPQQAQSYAAYGQYGAGAAPAAQAPPQVPMFQMPPGLLPQGTAQPGVQASSDKPASDPYAQYYAQWYAQQMANYQQNNSGGAPGQQ